MLNIDPVQTTQQLTLRQFGKDDVAWVSDIAKQPGFHFFRLLPADRFPAEKVHQSAIDLVEHCQEKSIINLNTGLPAEWKLAITHPVTGDGIGYACLGPLLDPQERDIGYFVDPRQQGKGYAKTVMSQMINSFYDLAAERPELFKDDDLKISATVHPENQPSIRVLSSLGFVFEGEKTSIVYGLPEPRLCCELTPDHFTGYRKNDYAYR